MVTGRAPFTEDWLVEPNRADRIDDLRPDSREKGGAHVAGKSLMNAPILGQGTNVVPHGK